MAEVVVNEIQKACATCEWWGGERKIGCDSTFVMCIQGTHGKCLNPKSHCRGVDMGTHAQNPCYQKWRYMR